MKKVFITGGLGFIGSHFARRLVRDGYEVLIYDSEERRGTPQTREELASEFGIRTDIGMLQNRDYLTTSLVSFQPDYVAHLGAQVAVTTSVADPMSDFESNASGTINLLEAIRLSESKVRTLFSSTNKVYGALRDHQIGETESRYVLDSPIGESQPLDFHSPYGCSKGAADQYVLDYGRTFGLENYVLRQSCIYGTRQFGIEDQGWVAWFVIAAILGKPVTVYGSGKQVRDLLWIDDLIDAYYLVLFGDLGDERVFNIGGGLDNSLSVLELVDFIRENTNLSLEHRFSSPREGDQKVFISDNSLLTSVSGWLPTTPVVTGLATILDWAQSNKHRIEKVLNAS